LLANGFKRRVGVLMSIYNDSPDAPVEMAALRQGLAARQYGAPMLPPAV